MPQSTARAAATDERLSGLSIPEGAAWATDVRKLALERLNAMGLPSRRDEYWKYTDPTSLMQATALSAPAMVDEETPIFDDIDRLKVVFRDGVYDASASDDLALAGLEIERLADAAKKDIHWVKDAYGQQEAKGQNPVARPLATFNSAFATDGAIIRVTGNVAKPVSLIYLHENDHSDAVLHHVVRLEKGASMTLLENGPAAARFNSVLEVEVADGASFHHIRSQGRDHERRAATHLFAQIGTKSLFKSFTMTANGALTRNEAVLDIVGNEAIAHVAGAALGDGVFHHDDTVFVTHQGVSCESRQVYKKVLRNGATGVFQGKILVKPGAQKTDGYQISQALLLDDDSQFLAKPELEIYADDVACSHGSTSGAIDDGALFYLRSRGIPKPEAQDFLTLAFLAEAIEEIENEDIAADVLERLASWLQRRR